MCQHYLLSLLLLPPLPPPPLLLLLFLQLLLHHHHYHHHGFSVTCRAQRRIVPVGVWPMFLLTAYVRVCASAGAHTHTPVLCCPCCGCSTTRGQHRRMILLQVTMAEWKRSHPTTVSMATNQNKPKNRIMGGSGVILPDSIRLLCWQLLILSGKDVSRVPWRHITGHRFLRSISELGRQIYTRV